MMFRNNQTNQIPEQNPAIQQNYTLQPRVKQPDMSKVYRVIINSNDWISGTIDNGIYAVNLPKSPNRNKCMLFVDFFAYEDETNSAITNLDRFAYNIHIREIVQPNSYRSLTKSPTDIILTLKGREYDGVPDWTAIGVPMTDKMTFEGNTINVYMTSRNMSTATLASRHWTMVLVILEHET